MGWLKKMFRGLLKIAPAVDDGRGVAVVAEADFCREVLRNSIWYRGSAAELAQFYALSDDLIGNASFWAAGSANSKIRKIHSGLPALIVDTVSDIVVSDLEGVRLDGAEAQADWDAIARENDFGRLLKRAVRTTAALGDGAFKISFDPAISPYPIIEFFGADRVRFEYCRGRVAEVVFVQETGEYTLEEIYSKAGIRYRAWDRRGREVKISEPPTVAHSLGVNLAVPLIFDENSKFSGRGKSVFDGKMGAFDALDEALSQWVDALRDGRARQYIPVGLLPRNPDTGEIMGLKNFESRFVQTEMDLAEGADNSIKVVQPAIDTQALEASVSNFLTFALQGILAPATLGIDLKRRDNAEAQREREKATLYTRAKVILALREAVAKLAEAAVMAYNGFYGRQVPRCVATVEFGEYAAPDFKSQIETIGRGKELGLISLKTAVEQLYGNTWTKEQKEQEVKNLEEEKDGKIV